mmetsp:Transcript_156208/g.501164  ORF Transcript_156208/g.501164 Transcript_156208/m.501164 type:complete len:259 (-) Transcript_156208:19-795(-)
MHHGRAAPCVCNAAAAGSYAVRPTGIGRSAVLQSLPSEIQCHGGDHAHSLRPPLPQPVPGLVVADADRPAVEPHVPTLPRGACCGSSASTCFDCARTREPSRGGSDGWCHEIRSLYMRQRYAGFLLQQWYGAFLLSCSPHWPAQSATRSGSGTPSFCFSSGMAPFCFRVRRLSYIGRLTRPHVQAAVRRLSASAVVWRLSAFVFAVFRTLAGSVGNTFRQRYAVFLLQQWYRAFLLSCSMSFVHWPAQSAARSGPARI